MSDAPHNHYVTDRAADIRAEWVLAQLRDTYFGKDRTDEQFGEQLRNSLCFGLFRREYLDAGFPGHRDEQVGFARVVTDYASFGWLADFVIAPESRGKGIGHFLLDSILRHHALKTVTMNLVTRDAQAFYSRFGFAEASHMMRRPI